MQRFVWSFSNGDSDCVLDVLLIFCTPGSKRDLIRNLGIKMCICVAKCFLTCLCSCSCFIRIHNGK